jgi:hypothetical protein
MKVLFHLLYHYNINNKPNNNAKGDVNVCKMAAFGMTIGERGLSAFLFFHLMVAGPASFAVILAVDPRYTIIMSFSGYIVNDDYGL